MTIVTIYALSEGPNDPPRYIGKTVKWLHERYNGHLSEARIGRKRPVYHWIRKLLKEGRAPTLIWLESVKSDQNWQERESYWIEKFRAEGFNLLNMTEGGEGMSGLRWSQSQRAKRALRNNGNAAAAAKKRAMTHCRRGHPWSSDNTYISRDARLCKQCHDIRRKAWRAERRRMGLPVL